MESKQSQVALMGVARMMVLAQEALKADYGFAGQDTPLFNGQYGLLPGSSPAHGLDTTQPVTTKRGGDAA